MERGPKWRNVTLFCTFFGDVIIMMLLKGHYKWVLKIDFVIISLKKYNMLAKSRIVKSPTSKVMGVWAGEGEHPALDDF